MATKNNNRTAPLIIIATIVLVGIIVVAALLTNQHSWAETYEPDDDNPYGSQVLFTLLKTARSNQHFIEISDSTFKDLPINPTDEVDSYLFIGNNFYADSSDVNRLLEFVSEGNSAFIITSEASHLIADSLLRVANLEMTVDSTNYIYQEDTLFEEDYYEEAEESNYEENNYEEFEQVVAYENSQKKQIANSYTDTTAKISLSEFKNGKAYYDVVKKYKDKKRLTEWVHFEDNLTTYNGDSVKILGRLEKNYSNYISFSYGKGQIYLHTTPIVFSNYYMINDTTMNYCRDALSYLGKGYVYWDEENRTYDYKASNHPSSQNNLTKPNEGPLEFILSEPGLRMAWYILLVGTVLYLMFGAKRKQRIIEPMENMENTSIEYAEVISQMFMKQSDHKKLISMKMVLFKSFLRDRFKIKLPTKMEDETDRLYSEISHKSDVKVEHVKNIFENYKYLSSIVTVETNEMLSFHQKLEHFYNNCK